MAQTTQGFLLFAARCRSEADERLFEAEALIEEGLRFAGCSATVTDAWIVLSSHDEPGCCEYTAEFTLETGAERGSDARHDELLRQLTDTLGRCGVTLCLAASPHSDSRQLRLAA